MELIKPERLSLKDYPELDEKWVRDRIAEDTTILGLGELDLRDKERGQPRAGRLDLLLQDPELNRRYEVELQLGSTDESHIIRTVEYWDIEKKRYPQYDHCAVIVAEDITARFLNVISLFNGHIPLIALQMSALKWDGKVALVFTKVLDALQRGLVDEDEEYETVDRPYWEKKASKDTLGIADELLKAVRAIDRKLDLNYVKNYVGLAKNGRPNNFVIFRPKKHHLIVEPRLDQSEEIAKLAASTGLDVQVYDKRWGRYRIWVDEDSMKKHSASLAELFRRAYDASA